MNRRKQTITYTISNPNSQRETRDMLKQVIVDKLLAIHMEKYLSHTEEN